MAVILSLAGIHAVMSFTVARRTREIGIRIATLLLLANGGQASARGVAILVAYSALMLTVCMLACIVPTRRALRIEPTEALRSE